MPAIERITIVGVGLIGASFALAIKQARFTGKICGCDSPRALHEAGAIGALDYADEDALSAVSKADLVMLAAPVQANIDVLRTTAPRLREGALVTDVGSTKSAIVAAADELFGANSLRRFLPGHPMAGKEVSGAENASAELFRGAAWVLTPSGGTNALIAPELSRGLHREFLSLLESIGARIVVTTPAKHDRIVAFTSHLPQMVSTALAQTVSANVGRERELRDLSGSALRSMVRLAASNADMWAQIAASNQVNLSEALSAMESALRELREAIGTAKFNDLFERARQFDPDAEPRGADASDPPKFW